MNESTLNRMIREHKARIIWFLVFLILAVFVTALVFGTLKRSVQAQTYTKRVFACSYAQEGAEPVAHQHNDDCYENGELICTLPERELHIHGDECYAEEKVLVCTLEEGEGHVHTDACYTEEPVLVCTLEESDGHVHSVEAGCYTRVQGDLICTNEDPEHVHTDDCYAWEEVLTCEIPEGEGAHHHSEECYETQLVLSCGKEEGEGAHTHDDSCYEIQRVLICDKEEVKTEHVHTVDCFQVVDMSPEEIHALRLSELPESDPSADVESPDVWESRFASVPLSGEWDRDLLKIAETQLGYTESQRNFEAVSDEYGEGYTLKGWTRYGAWYGIPYGDWCAMFISFCLNYADIPESAIPYDCATTTWIDSLSDRGMYASAGSYDPKPGDLIFFDWEGDGLSDHVGIVWAVNPGSITTIEGNHTPSVELFDYDLSDGHIQGYGILPENPALAVTESEENESGENKNPDGAEGGAASVSGTSDSTDPSNNNVDTENTEKTELDPETLAKMPPFSYSERVAGMRVTIEADAGAFPEGTTVEIKPIEDEGLAEKVAPAVSGQVVKVQAVDITFFDADGNEIEPMIPIRVSMRPFTETEADNIGVVHVDNDGVVSAVETQDGIAQPDQGVAFSADSFSTYAIVYTVTFAYDGDGNVYQYSMPGGTGLSLRELLIDLGMKTEDNVDSYLSHVVNVSFSKPDCMTLMKEGNDWFLKSVHAFDTTESLTVTFDDYSMLAIPVSVSGIEELRLENASISSADGVFLPDDAEGHADVVEDVEEAISAVESYVESAKNTPEEPAILETLQTLFSPKEEPKEELKEKSETAYQVFDIGLNEETINTEDYLEGFNVEVTLPERIAGKDFHLYHIYGEEGKEVVKEIDDFQLNTTKVETGEDLVNGFSFTTDSFSKFVLGYTVDFYYGEYEYHLGGGEAMTLGELFNILDIEENVEDVNTVTFTDPTLISVRKVEEGSTVGALKDMLGLVCEYSEKLTEEEIAENDEKIVQAGDWALISLKPFTTCEKLTITMKNGNLYEITVTDAISYDINTTENAFVNDPKYSSYYNANSPIGVAGSFHLVAFDTATLNVHTNGNVLANTLIAKANFGTNPKEDGTITELSYIQNYEQVHTSSASTTDGMLVLGSSNTVELPTDGGNQYIVNTVTVDKPYNIVKDEDTAVSPFINLETVYSNITTLSSNLNTIGASVGIGDGNENDSIAVHIFGNTDSNKHEITLKDADLAGYVNVTASQMNTLGSGQVLDIMGFSSWHTGSVVINVDCADVSVVNLPKAYVYLDGSRVNCAETVDFTGGKVIWNFVNAAGATINATEMTGIIIAPDSDVFLTSSFNGTVVANNITVNAESHRTDFTGTTNPTKKALTATKSVDNSVPSKNQLFHFTLEKLVNTNGTWGWSTVEEVTNNQGIITFGDQTYDSAGSFWYYVHESETESAASPYFFDNSRYIANVVIEEVSSNMVVKSTEKYFLSSGTSEGDIISYLTTGNIQDAINEGKVTIISTVEFKNYSKTTNLKVKKVWKGDQLDSISVTLYRTDPENSNQEPVSLQTIELSEANSWEHTFENLPKYKLTSSNALVLNNGEPISYQYYVEEDIPEGYTSSIVYDGKVATITNEKPYIPEPATTSVSVNKVWKANGVVVENPSDDDAVEVKLVRYKAPMNTVTLHFYYWDHNANCVKFITDLSVAKGSASVSCNVASIPKSGWTYQPNPKWYSVSKSKLNSSTYIPNDGTIINLANFEANGEMWIVAHDNDVNNYGSETIGDVVSNIKDKSSQSISSSVGEYQLDSTYKYVGDDTVDGITTLNSSNSWQYLFNNLPNKETDGVGQMWVYRYTVEEVSTGPFTTEVTGNSVSIDLGNSNSAIVAPDGGQIIITNTKTTDKNFSFAKIWRDAVGSSILPWPADKPITVTIKQGENDVYATYTINSTDLTVGNTINDTTGEKVKLTVTTVDDASARYVFRLSGLPDGYTYYVSEEKVEGYQSPKYFNVEETQEMGADRIGDQGTIYNDQIGYELPETGGSGTALYGLLGGLMVITAGAVLTLRKKKNKA